MDRAGRVLEYLTDQQGAMTEYLRELARVESPSTDPEAQARIFDLLSEPLEALDFQVRRLGGAETGGQLYARPRDRVRGQPAQLVVGHSDTVWAHGTLAEMPLEEESGRLRGPGVFDMKGGLVQIVFALRALRELELEPAVTPVVFINSDEEIGSPESEEHVRMLARRVERALILEPGLGPEAKIKTARRGTGLFRIRVVGRSAHTGLDPERGRSAIQELSHVIQALHAMTERDRGVEVNVGRVEGGTRPNVVAAEAEALVDVRVPTLDAARRVEEKVLALESTTAGTSLEIQGAVDRPPMEPTPRNRALWNAVREAGAALGLELEEGTSGGASDGNTTSQYTATIDGLGPVGDGAHASHEFVDLTRLPERTALLAEVLMLPSLAGRADEDVSEEVAEGRSRPRRAGAPAD